MYLSDFETYLSQENCYDLFFIISEMKQKNIMSFPNFLKEISCGFGIVTSEETGFGLENDYDNPNDFEEIIFFIGGYESSVVKTNKFCDLLKVLSQMYLAYYPNESIMINKYILDIYQKYYKDSNDAT